MEMEAATVPQIEKREYKNNTNGWLGVVVIDARGEEKGVSVEPNGTVWLSEAEAILTARAPRRPEDNPFEEQKFIGINEAGQREEFLMRPLVPADTDPRYVPSQDRYVPPLPSTDAEAAVHAEAAAKFDSVVTSPQAAAREAAVKASPPEQGALTGPQPEPPTVPAAPSTGSLALSGQPGPSEEGEQKQSWTEPPPSPGEILAGALQGTDTPAPQPGQAPDPTDAPSGATSPPQPPAPVRPPTAPAMTREELEGGLPPQEEYAAAVDSSIGEETGQARPPVGDAPEGEYAAAEEVGSPDAPAADGTEAG